MIKDAFSHGVFEDFPAEHRREKEISKRLKPKKVGQKSGREQIQAQINEVLIDEVADNVGDGLGHEEEGRDNVDEVSEILHEGQNLERGDNVNEVPIERVVQIDVVTNNVIDDLGHEGEVGDNIDHITPAQLHAQSVLHEAVEKDHSSILTHLTLSPPSFDLMSEFNPPQLQLVPDSTTQVKHLPTAAQQQPPPAVQQQPPPAVQQHPSFVVEQQPEKNLQENQPE